MKKPRKRRKLARMKKPKKRQGQQHNPKDGSQKLKIAMPFEEAIKKAFTPQPKDYTKRSK